MKKKNCHILMSILISAVEKTVFFFMIFGARQDLLVISARYETDKKKKKVTIKFTLLYLIAMIVV